MSRHKTLILFFAAGLALASWPSLSAGIDMGPAEFVQAGGKDVLVSGYSAPSFEDWNGDGLKDLIIGEGGGSILGKVRVYLNVGTETQPQFAGYLYAKCGDVDLTCAPSGCMGCYPRFVDWDQDGRKDLLVGQSDGVVKIFMNVAGPNDLPVLDDGAKITVGSGAPLDLDVGYRATPTPVDWNDDGLLDLVVGGMDGAIHLYLNCGCNGGVPPAFYASGPLGDYVQENGTNLFVPGARSSPVVMDLDGDGKKDVLTGNTNGQMLFYKNVSTDGVPAFSGYSLVTSKGAAIQLTNSLRTRPFVCNWTGAKDGYWDILLGYGDGKVRLYRGLPKAGDLDLDGDIDGDDFTILCKALDQPIPADGTPADLNADDVVDNQDLRLFADLWLTEHK
jgi:hypothetical protein